MSKHAGSSVESLVAELGERAAVRLLVQKKIIAEEPLRSGLRAPSTAVRRRDRARV